MKTVRSVARRLRPCLRLLVGLTGVAACAASVPVPARAALPSTSASTPVSVDTPTWETAAGPWGRLRYARVRLRTPSATLEGLRFPAADRWFFPREETPGLDAWLAAAPLTPAQRAPLLDPARRTADPATGGIWLQVDDAWRHGLGAEARLYLYRRLARHPQNAAQAFPFALPPDDVLARAELNPTLRAALARLAYPAGGRRLISDTDLLLPLAQDDEERTELARALCTFDTLAVDVLRPESAAEATAMAAYWSPGGSPRAGDALRRFALTPDLAEVGLATFLPPLPQALLNRFADGQTSPGRANCFWMSLNFFRLQTNDAVLPTTDDAADLSLPATMADLDQHYEPVTPPYRLGDVICLTTTRADGQTVLSHMVAYVADGVVLTKNGAGAMSPFMLSPLAEVLDHYSWPEPVELHAFRPRPGSPALPVWEDD